MRHSTGLSCGAKKTVNIDKLASYQIGKSDKTIVILQLEIPRNHITSPSQFSHRESAKKKIQQNDEKHVNVIGRS